LYSIIFQTTLTQNSNPIKIITNRTDNSKFQLFNTIKFIKYKLILSKKNKNCEKWPDICLANIWKIKILFWPLSNLDISNTYFSDKNKIINWKITNFPYYWWNVYFVKGRWFIINKKSKNKIAALKFVNEYIKQWLNWNFKLWPNTLSAFNNIYEKQKLNLKYSKITQYEDYFELLINTENKIKEIFRNTKFLNAIEGKYSLNWLLDSTEFIKTVLK
jgi:hypothetical protein